MTNLIEFIRESNRIEGIESFDEEAQHEIYVDFIHKKKLSITSIEDLAKKLYKTSYDPQGRNPSIRSEEGQDVKVGNKRPQRGGFYLVHRLKDILYVINHQKHSRMAYSIHQDYEELHPLTDGNGRTGRAIWAWLMVK